MVKAGLGSDAVVEGGPVEVGGYGDGEAGDVAACDLDSPPLRLVGGPYEGVIVGEEGGGRAGRVAGAVVAVDADDDVGLVCGCVQEVFSTSRRSKEKVLSDLRTEVLVPRSLLPLAGERMLSWRM